MRTIEQVASDLTKARAETARSQQVEKRYEDELIEIHSYLTMLIKPRSVPREIDYEEGNRG